jgi:hypothetical protein
METEIYIYFGWIYPPPQKKSTLNSCIFILKLMNSDNSEHYLYIVCKCLSSIIYYDLYMHKVDCFFLFQS